MVISDQCGGGRCGGTSVAASVVSKKVRCRFSPIVLLSLMIMAASAAAVQTELEALFIGIPKDFVTIAYRDKGGMNASNVLACLKKQGDALVCPPRCFCQKTPASASTAQPCVLMS